MSEPSIFSYTEYPLTKEALMKKRRQEERIPRSRICSSCSIWKGDCDGRRPCGPCTVFLRDCADDPNASKFYPKGKKLTACESCRRSKRKCDKKDPCSTCVTSGETCSLSAKYRSMGRPSARMDTVVPAKNQVESDPINAIESEPLPDGTSEEGPSRTSTAAEGTQSQQEDDGKAGEEWKSLVNWDDEAQ